MTDQELREQAIRHYACVRYRFKPEQVTATDVRNIAKITEFEAEAKYAVEQRTLVLKLVRFQRAFVEIVPSLPINFDLAEDVDESKDLALLMQSLRKLIGDSEALLAAIDQEKEE